MEDKFVKKVVKHRDSWAGSVAGGVAARQGILGRVSAYFAKSSALRNSIIITGLILFVGLPSYSLYKRLIPKVTNISYLNLDLLALPDGGIKVNIKMPVLEESFNEGLGFLVETERTIFPADPPLVFRYTDIKGSICGVAGTVIKEKFFNKEIILIRPEKPLTECKEKNGHVEFTAYGPVYDYGLERRLKLMVIPEQVYVNFDSLNISFSFTEAVSELSPKFDLLPVEGSKVKDFEKSSSKPEINTIRSEYKQVVTNGKGLLIQGSWKRK